MHRQFVGNGYEIMPHFTLQIEISVNGIAANSGALELCYTCTVESFEGGRAKEVGCSVLYCCTSIRAQSGKSWMLESRHSRVRSGAAGGASMAMARGP